MTKKKAFIISGIIVAATIGILLLMGRNAICTCGYVKLWHGIVNSSGDSQHIFDWYSLTHFLHGLGFYLLLFLVEKISKKKIPILTKMIIAVALACGWEILENSDPIINHYRAETFSLNYYGDSIINSVGDIISMGLGFLLAYKKPVWMSIVAFIIIELFLLWAIRDNLTINIIMLIHPIEALKLWQAAG